MARLEEFNDFIRRNEPLARHVEERRQHPLVHHSAGAELGVDHLQAPIKHRLSGNVRPLSLDPRLESPPRATIDPAPCVHGQNNRKSALVTHRL